MTQFLSVLSFYIFRLPFIQHTNVSSGEASIQESKSGHIARHCGVQESVTYGSWKSKVIFFPF